MITGAGVGVGVGVGVGGGVGLGVGLGVGVGVGVGVDVGVGVTSTTWLKTSVCGLDLIITKTDNGTAVINIPRKKCFQLILISQAGQLDVCRGSTHTPSLPEEFY